MTTTGGLVDHEPFDKLPGIAHDRLVLAAKDGLAVAVAGFDCYPEGMQFRVRLRTRAHDSTVNEAGKDVSGDGGLELRGLELTVTYPTGEVARTGNHNLSATSGPVLFAQGGGGGIFTETAGRQVTAWDFDFWASPLPPTGEVVFSVRWPQLGLEGSASIPAEKLRQAADQAVPLWS